MLLVLYWFLPQEVFVIRNVTMICILNHPLQLPTHNLKFYSQHSSEDTNVMDADILGGGDVSQWKLRHKEKVQTATACLELECNQVKGITVEELSLNFKTKKILNC